MSRLSRDTWLSYAWLTQAGVQWAERDPIGLLAGASPTNGSPGLPLPLPYIYILGKCPCVATEPYNNTITYVHVCYIVRDMCPCVASGGSAISPRSFLYKTMSRTRILKMSNPRSHF